MPSHLEVVPIGTGFAFSLKRTKQDLTIAPNVGIKLRGMETIMNRLWAQQANTGMHIPAIKKITLFSPNEWEEFVEEWLTTKKDYSSIERIGGAGDQGRDVIGFISKPIGNVYQWDNYQCKHYDHALRPSDVWDEFGKLCYYTFLGDFPVPNSYFFVCPYNVGASLSNLMRNPIALREGLIANWDTYCSNKITKKTEIKLDGALLAYVNNFDFSIFDKITPLTLIQEHESTPFFIPRFGGGLPPRPSLKPVPKNILNHELPYIKELLKAYNSDSDRFIENIDALNEGERYQKHFSRSREYFHQAEQLKNFSRDKLPPETFEILKGEIFSGTIDIVEDDHETGFVCLKEVEKEARKLNVTSNPLSKCSDGNDRVGICHHLANDGRLIWQEDDCDS